MFCFNDPATTEIYTYGHTLSLHHALPILHRRDRRGVRGHQGPRRGLKPMCGRITQRSPPDQLSLLSVSLVEDVWGNDRRERYNGAPGQKHWVLRQHPEPGRRSLDRLVWGLVPHEMQ